MAKRDSKDKGGDSVLDRELDMTPLGGEDLENDIQVDMADTMDYTGPGDMWPTMAEEPEKKTKKGQIQATAQGISVSLPPVVLLWYFSWLAAHREMFPGETQGQMFGYYVVDALFRDVKADAFRQEDERQYDPQSLYLEGLMPLIEAEVRTREEEIAAGVRRAIRERLEALHKQGVITEEALVAAEAAGGVGDD